MLIRYVYFPLVWFGGTPPGLEVPNLHLLTWVLSSCEVPTPFERATRAAELRGLVALVKPPLEGVLPAPGVRFEAESSL